MKTTISHLKHFTIILLCFAAIASTGQTETNATKNKRLSGGFGYFSLSGEQLNLNDLNRSLSALGYTSFNTMATSFGGGGLFSINNFLLGGGGASLNSQNVYNETNAINLKGGYGFFNFGYIVYSGKRSVLYPAIGLGAGGYSLSIRKKNLPGNFTQQLNTPEGMVTTEVSGRMLNLELNYLLFLRKEKTGFYLGFKAGYKYSPQSWETKLVHASLTNSPNMNMNGFYASILIGGGGLSQTK